MYPQIKSVKFTTTLYVDINRINKFLKWNIINNESHILQFKETWESIYNFFVKKQFPK